MSYVCWWNAKGVWSEPASTTTCCPQAHRLVAQLHQWMQYWERRPLSGPSPQLQDAGPPLPLQIPWHSVNVSLLLWDGYVCAALVQKPQLNPPYAAGKSAPSLKTAQLRTWNGVRTSGVMTEIISVYSQCPRVWAKRNTYMLLVKWLLRLLKFFFFNI